MLFRSMLKAVVLLLAFVALACCAPADCGATPAPTAIATPNSDGSWSTGYNVSLAVGTAGTYWIQCYTVNGTNPDSTVNNTLVLAGRFDPDSPNTNSSFLVVWNADGTTFANVTVSTEDDVDSACVLNSTTGVTAADGLVWFGVYTTAVNNTVDVWTQITDEPACGADVDLSGGSSFWIWIIVAVVIVVVIAVIIAGAGALVYYQKKKKGQAKLYEDS